MQTLIFFRIDQDDTTVWSPSRTLMSGYKEPLVVSSTSSGQEINVQLRTFLLRVYCHDAALNALQQVCSRNVRQSSRKVQTRLNYHKGITDKRSFLHLLASVFVGIRFQTVSPELLLNRGMHSWTIERGCLSQIIALPEGTLQANGNSVDVTHQFFSDSIRNKKPRGTPLRLVEKQMNSCTVGFLSWAPGYTPTQNLRVITVLWGITGSPLLDKKSFFNTYSVSRLVRPAKTLSFRFIIRLLDRSLNMWEKHKFDISIIIS